MVMAIGDANAKFRVYMGNEPKYSWNNASKTIAPLTQQEISCVGKQCGNGWRKVFNVYAKLIYALGSDYVNSVEQYDSWQLFRDKKLLQQDSDTLLCFQNMSIENDLFENSNVAEGAIKLVMGRTYAKTLRVPKPVNWLNHEFAIDCQNKIIVCPYFDYRQLSNHKIIYLVETIKANF